MTDKENKELEKFFETQPLKVRRLIYKWLKQQKELAVAEYKLKKKMETKFYTSSSGDNWKWKCIKCGAEGGLYDAHYGVLGGYVCNNCLTDRP